jgi:hypothetical protein
LSHGNNTEREEGRKRKYLMECDRYFDVKKVWKEDWIREIIINQHRIDKSV